jgi:TPR repeat protein/tRNA A-37 threonylcarbamoyl transferase component Bud32
VVTENANIDRKCEKCGAPLAADAPEGLCPRCLMALNLATQTEAPGAEVGPDGTQVVPPKQQPPPPLEEIARHFPQLEILECLGRGGMGVVYKARQPRLGRFVALKILSREKEKDQHFAERFTREAQALARLNHPNIVTVYDFGEANGLFYLLMEFVDGMSLRQLLQTRKLAPEEALVIVPSICEALQYAHQQGIVHRDIKPENILLDKQGRVKIADFGIAKLLGTDGKVESLTGEQQVVGTPHYMAPEQVEKPGIVDHRADIFSLGVVFYEMLTGELPLGKFAPPSKKVHMDVRLDEVVLHALEKEPERRYQQASQVKSDVETIASTDPAQAGKAPPAFAPPVAGDALRQVKGPGTGLVITAILNWLAIPLTMLIALFVVKVAQRPGAAVLPSAILLLVPLSALVLSTIIMIAGLKMKRLQAYGLAVLGSILAILVTPGNLVGLPIGIWALVVLSQRHVREAFGKGHAVSALEAAPPANGGGWKVAAVIVGAVLLILAIPVGAVLMAIIVPAVTRQRATVTQQQMARLAPTFVVRGTVTDAVTGKPIAGARVDDNAFGTRPNRPPQQAWTDAQGQYELRTWYEEHTLAASAPGYETKLYVFVTKNLVQGRPAQIDFQLQSAEAGEAATSGLEAQALGEKVRRGSQAWRSGDYSKAFALLLPAALKSDPIAQHRIGVMYANGQEVETDLAEASRWFRKAAEQGQAESQYSMGLRYLKGESVARDPKEAARWFKLAADQGIGAAAAALARQCAAGDGVPEDLVEAYKWAAVAASLPDPNSGDAILRDLEGKLTADQRADAKRLLKEFVPKRTAPADP